MIGDAALSPNALPYDVSNVIIILMFLFVILWGYRVVLKSCLLSELNLASTHSAILRLEDIPQSQLQQEGGFIPRSQFEKILRNRRMKMFPPKVVQLVTSPVHILRSSIELVDAPLEKEEKGEKEKEKEKEMDDTEEGKEEEHNFGVKFSFDAKTPCVVSVNWGVSRHQFDRLLGISRSGKDTEEEIEERSGEKFDQLIVVDKSIEGEIGEPGSRSFSLFSPQKQPFEGIEAKGKEEKEFSEGLQQWFESEGLERDTFFSLPFQGEGGRGAGRRRGQLFCVSVGDRCVFLFTPPSPSFFF